MTGPRTDAGPACPPGLAVAAWALGVRLRSAQDLGADLWYAECCAAYAATVAGAPGYRTLLGAWDQLRRAVGWQEVTEAHARSLGARLRRVPWGTRRGRHLVLTTGALQLLRALQAELPPLAGWEAPGPAGGEWVGVVPSREPEPGRVVGARCPFHGDRHPSLMVRRDERGDWGTGLCLTCGTRVAVRFDGGEVRVRAVGGEPHRVGCDTALGVCNNTLMGGAVAGVQPVPPVPGIPARRAGSTVGATLHVGGRTRGHRLAGGLAGVLARAEARSLAPAALRRAGEAAWTRSMAGQGEVEASGKCWMPVRLVAGCGLAGEALGFEQDGAWVRTGTAWRAVAQGWVSLDLDGLALPAGDTGDAVLRGAARALASGAPGASPGLDGGVLVVRSGPCGAHVHLRVGVPRDPGSLWGDPVARAWYAALGAWVLGVVRAAGAAGGRVDPACAGPGRWWRAPGWRVLPDGSLFRARLVAALV